MDERDPQNLNLCQFSRRVSLPPIFCMKMSQSGARVLRKHCPYLKISDETFL